MTSKDRERAILRLVYGDGELEDVEAGERPDFRARKPGQHTRFGIEVTEFYYSESSARVHHLPDYVSEILSTGRYKHKDDREALTVVQATLVRDSGDEEPIRGILVHLPEAAEYRAMVTEVIREKDMQLPGYAQDLTHVNLIVFDTENRLFQIDTESFYRWFFDPKLKAAVRQTGFREVYFVTRVENDKWVYVPLKLWLFQAELCMLDYVLVMHYPGLCESIQEELAMFAQHLKRRGFDDVYVRDAEADYEVIWGNYGVILTPEKEPTFRDYGDYQLPGDVSRVQEEPRMPFTDSAFAKSLRSVQEEWVLSTGAAFEVKADVSSVWSS